MIVTKNYFEPPSCEKEILRYAGCRESSQDSLQLFDEHASSAESLESLLAECLDEVLPRLSYKVCYIELPVTITEDICDFGCMSVQSKALAKNLKGCEQVLLFGATIGVEIDRLIAKYGRISPTKALMFQAIGAERIEALCDVFCEEIRKEMQVTWDGSEKNVIMRPRFSPGYGDVPLETQKEIFAILNCGKNIGLTLNDSLLMSPSKSITAFVGIEILEQNKSAERIGKTSNEGEKGFVQQKKCAACDKTDCAYRGI